MCVSESICIWICTCIHIGIPKSMFCVYPYLYMHIRIHIHICICNAAYASLKMHTYFIPIYIYICKYIYISYIHIFTYIYIYIYAYLLQRLIAWPPAGHPDPAWCDDLRRTQYLPKGLGISTGCPKSICH